MKEERDREEMGGGKQERMRAGTVEWHSAMWQD